MADQSHNRPDAPANVRPIAPAVYPVVPAVVEELERLLVGAREGRIVGLAWVAQQQQRSFEEGCAGTGTTELIPFLAYLRVLQLRIEREIEF